MIDTVEPGRVVQVHAPHSRQNGLVGTLVRPLGQYQALVEVDDGAIITVGRGVLNHVHRCRVCGAVSHNPNDIEARYCARCNHWCIDEDPPTGDNAAKVFPADVTSAYLAVLSAVEIAAAGRGHVLSGDTPRECSCGWTETAAVEASPELPAVGGWGLAHLLGALGGA